MIFSLNHVGYNDQTADEAEYHMIIAHEVTNKGSDRSQLSPMAVHAQAALDSADLSVIADAGYLGVRPLIAAMQDKSNRNLFGCTTY